MLTVWRVVRMTQRIAAKQTIHSTTYNTAYTAFTSRWCDAKTTSKVVASRSRYSHVPSPKQLYHTCTTRYADAIHSNNNSKDTNRVDDGSAQHKLLKQAHELVAVVEQQGENAEECAREALNIYERLLTQSEQLSEAEQASCYDGMGVCYMKIGNIEAAEKALERGLELHPDTAPLWLHMGELHQLQGRHLQAVSLFGKFIEHSKQYYYTTETKYDLDTNAVQYHYTPRRAPNDESSHVIDKSHVIDSHSHVIDNSHVMDSVHVLCVALFKRAVSYIRIQEESMALADLWLIVDTKHSPHWTSRAYLAIAQLARLRGDWHQARNLASKSIDTAAQDTEQSRDRAQLLSQAHHVRAVCYEALEDESRAEQDHVLADFYFRESAFKKT